MFSLVFNFLKATLSGIAQVIVQPCALSGLIILASIAWHSWQMALGGLLGAVIGTLSAALLKFKREDIYLGIYGYNATLIGIANVYFFKTTAIAIVVFIVTCILSIYVTKWVPRYLKLPAFTGPFVMITWLVLLLKDVLNLTPAENILNFTNNIYTAGLAESIGQVYIQGNGVTGLIMLFAVLLCSRSSFVWTVVAVIATWLLAHLMTYPEINIQNGLYGFSAVLTAIALQHMKPVIYPLAGIVLTVFVTQAFIYWGWPSLTAPFVIVASVITVIYAIHEKYWRTTS